MPQDILLRNTCLTTELVASTTGLEADAETRRVESHMDCAVDPAKPAHGHQGLYIHRNGMHLSRLRYNWRGPMPHRPCFLRTVGGSRTSVAKG